VSALRFLPRYSVIGVLCALFNNLLLIALDMLGLHFSVSVAISVAVMIPLGFLLQSRLTFAAQPNWPSFWRYAAGLIGNLPLAWLLMWLFRDQAGMPMFIAAPVVTAIAFLLNFAASYWALAQRPTQLKTVD